MAVQTVLHKTPSPLFCEADSRESALGHASDGQGLSFISGIQYESIFNDRFRIFRIVKPGLPVDRTRIIFSGGSDGEPLPPSPFPFISRLTISRIAGALTTPRFWVDTAS